MRVHVPLSQTLGADAVADRVVVLQKSLQISQIGKLSVALPQTTTSCTVFCPKVLVGCSLGSRWLHSLCGS